MFFFLSAIFIVVFAVPRTSLGVRAASDQRRTFQCMKYMKPCQWEFVLEQWTIARIELGRPKLKLNEHKEELMYYLSRDHSPVYLFYTEDKAPMFIGIVLKTASEAIIENLREGLGEDVAHFDSGVALRAYRDKMTRQQKEKQNNSYAETVLFVRDPFDHFNSALTEIISRTYHYGGIHNHNYSLQDINSFSMEQYLDCIIDATQTVFSNFKGYRIKDIPIMYQMEHLNFVSAPFFYYNFTMVKHLSTFQEDWETVRQRFGFKFELDMDIGRHEDTAIHHPALLIPAVLQANATASSRANLTLHDGMNETGPGPISLAAADDALHVNSRLRALYAAKPEYIRALCRVLMIEYVCLPEYEMPPACRTVEMLADVERGRERLLNCSKEDDTAADF